MSWQYLAGYLGTMTLAAMAWLGRRRYTRRRKPAPIKHGPLDEWLTNPDLIARRIARMTEQRFVADAILGPGRATRVSGQAGYGASGADSANV